MNMSVATGCVEDLVINGRSADRIRVDLHGVIGDRHYGSTRVLSGHDKAYIETSSLNKGKHVFNWRAWTGLSSEETAEVGKALGFEIPVGCLLENIRFSGIPNFSKLAPTTRLVFPYHDGSQAILAVWEENGPCPTVGRRLEVHHKFKGLKQGFVAEAKGRRGVMGIVLSSGTIYPKDQVLVYPPVR